MISPISGTLPSDWQEHAVTRQTDIYVGTNETLIPQTYLIMNSVELTQSVCTDGKFHLGGVISSRLTFKVNHACITFGDDKLKVYEHIVLDDDSEYDIPLGVYFVDRTDSVITEDGEHFEGSYVAYDAFSRADKFVTQAEAEGFRTAHGEPSGETLYNLVDWVENIIHLYASAATKTAISAHSNNSRPYINIEKTDSTYKEYGYYLYKAARDGLTYRDVLSSVAVMLGGAFLIDRTGSGLYFKLVPFAAGETPVLALTASDRIRSSIDTHAGKPMIREITYGNMTVTDPITNVSYTDARLSLGDLAIVQLPEVSARPQQQYYVLQAALETLSMQLGNWRRTSGDPVSQGPPLALTSAEIDYFGDPALEAGDFIRCTTNSGNTDFYVLEHIYRPHRPSVIRSYAETNNALYTNTRSPSYGETRRPAGYDAALAAQIARLSESSQDISDTLTALQTDINDDLTSLDTRLTAAEEAISGLSTDIVYSAEERLIGKWIDDSDLYEKTIVISALGDTLGPTVSVSHGIDALGSVVESRGQLVLSDGSSRPLCSQPLSGGSAVSYVVDRSAVTVTREALTDLWDGEYPSIDTSVRYKAVNVGNGTFTLSTTTPKANGTGCALFLLAGSVSTGADNPVNGVSLDAPRTVTASGGYVTVAYRIMDFVSPAVDPRNYQTVLTGADDLEGSMAYVTLRYTKRASIPDWFPNVSPVDDLTSHFGNDLSGYYVDVCLYHPSAGYRYSYTRCYCDTDNSLKIMTNNMTPPSQILESYTVNNSKIAYRQVFYRSDGTVYSYNSQAWNSFNRNFGGDDFDPAKLCIVEQGSSYTAWAPAGYSFEII